MNFVFLLRQTKMNRRWKSPGWFCKYLV